ncbi:cellulose synthase operon protein YhjQ [Pseudomonas taetrolens]|uniref:Cellulose synthase n=1 Tax=Pseudomonas taetrolens TaxID=47884 RepID=A0A0J6GKJ8_PSETA|nr:cellulose biosynthesis protein BcsQ [Pseudomonas taetrolens]KMM85186.1 cellulose synthase [Pseudomonas taetrolens]SEC44905.1 cellulose synthase operon protein YhjQ [Pseudomonas taetrolens]SQF86587.1 cellulose synthase [Pseudomonas taetrolens]VEH49664.1 cellulose synthase [Pseudomonas taetrolens]
MIALSLRGVRGGVGTSSTLAGLAFALHALGQRVLVVDMCPENALGLHFNLDFAQHAGWARATLDQQPWHQSAWSIESGLCVLPYGELHAHEQDRLDALLLTQPQLWSQRQVALTEGFDWILFDLPQRLPGHAANPRCDFSITVVNADAACHVLLQRQPEPMPLLINRYDVACQLQRDLVLIWQHRYAQTLVPISLHADEAMNEALARREPVGRYAPGSLIAQDVISLASWCLLRGRRPE